jgi:hypothetical protein
MSRSIITTLQEALGPDKVLTESHARREKRHDYWVLSQLEDMQGRGAPEPICVVQPADTSDVVTIVNACRESAAGAVRTRFRRMRRVRSMQPPCFWI